jgi:hypothetical protein
LRPARREPLLNELHRQTAVVYGSSRITASMASDGRRSVPSAPADCGDHNVPDAAFSDRARSSEPRPRIAGAKRNQRYLATSQVKLRNRERRGTGSAHAVFPSPAEQRCHSAAGIVSAGAHK